MKKNMILGSILLGLIGVVVIVLGGMDDSPGSQLIGLAVVIAGIVVYLKSKEETKPNSRKGR